MGRSRVPIFRGVPDECQAVGRGARNVGDLAVSRESQIRGVPEGSHQSIKERRSVPNRQICNQRSMTSREASESTRSGEAGSDI